MKIKSVIAALILAALPVAGAAGEEQRTAPQTAEAMPSFTIERAYFGRPGGSSLAGLIRSLDRARENGMTKRHGAMTRRVAFSDRRSHFHGHSMQRLVLEQAWRSRVSRELEALLN